MTTARKIWIERSVVLVSFVQITSCGIRLPDFDERMRNWPRVLIQYWAAHNDPFAERLAAVVSRQIASHHIHCLFSEQGPRHFCKCVRQIHQRFRGSTFDGGHVRRMKMLRLRTMSWPSISRDGSHALTLLLCIPQNLHVYSMLHSNVRRLQNESRPRGRAFDRPDAAFDNPGRFKRSMEQAKRYENMLIAILFVTWGTVFLDRTSQHFLAPYFAPEFHLSHAQIGMLGSGGLLGSLAAVLLCLVGSRGAGSRSPSRRFLIFLAFLDFPGLL